MIRADELLVPRRFSEAIERIARRRSDSFAAATLQEGGVCLATLHEQRHQVARLLVSDLLADRLAATPGRMYTVRTDGKARRLYAFSAVELIIHDAVAAWLAERVAPELSPALYSYRPRFSYQHAVRDFARYVRGCSTSPARTAEWGLYVLRRDVQAYFDSIPVHDDAPLWGSLARLVGPVHGTGQTWSLIRRTLRPQLVDGEGGTFRLSRGIPTGSPVANVVANLYLRGMDHALSSVAGGFYARYGDDIVAAHPEPEVVAFLRRTLDADLGALGVEFNAKKMQDLYLTVPGRPSPHDLPARPAVAVEFLGHRISARGTVGLSARKTQALLGALRDCAANAAGIDRQDLPTRIGRAVRAMNRLLDPRNSAAHPYAMLLRTTVTDRAYLEWLDHELALITLEAVWGNRSPRHFRSFPPRVLRTRFRLRSVVAARNRCGR